MDVPAPPEHLHPVGMDRSGATGLRQLRVLRENGLTRSSTLLEIGCGVGRLVYAMATTGFLVGYRGFDIKPKPVAWLTENYGFDGYEYACVDVGNGRYNPRGSADATEAGFPFDGPFDMVCAFSVFTHMHTDAVAAYLAEIARVLTGRAVVTFYAVAVGDTPSHKGRLFERCGGGEWTTFPDQPEKAIGFDDDVIEGMVADAGLAVERVMVGSWRGGRSDFGQDVYVLTPA